MQPQNFQLFTDKITVHKRYSENL